MKKYIHFYLAFLLIVVAASCTGKQKSFQSKSSTEQIEKTLTDSIPIITDFKVITTPNAPSRITRKVRQDKEGNLLIAAFEDVILYDGNSFKNFTKEAGLDSCHAFDVLEDRKGNIWIASTHWGIFLYDGKTFSHFTTDNGLPNNRTMCLYEDKAGNIWIGSQGGISCYDGKPFQNFTTKDGLTHNDVNTIMEDRQGNIWIGTRGTACVYDPQTSTFKEIRNEEGKPFGNVWSIIEDKRGNIWLNSGGLWRYDGHSFTHITPEGGICIYEDKKGNIWFNPGHTELGESGLSRFDAEALLEDKPRATQIFNKPDGTFLGISEDNEGNIWIGGGDGIWCYDGKTVKYYTSKINKN